MQKIKLLSGMLFSAQTAITALLMYYISKLDVLPEWIVLVVVAVCSCLVIINMLLICFFQRKRYKLLATLIAVAFCVIAVIPVNLMRHAEYTLNNLQGATIEYDSTYEIVVRKDDNASYLNDVAMYKIGIDVSHDLESVNQAIKDVEQKLGINLQIVEYDSYPNLLNALVETKEVSAAFMDTSFLDMFDEMYESNNQNINDHIKRIENVTVTIKVETNENEQSQDDIREYNLYEKPFVIYISGIDVSGKITSRSRSDVNILIVMNPIDKKILLVTVPRDTYVPLSGDEDEKFNGKYDKLTHAGIYGDNCSVSISTLEKSVYTGINIDRWIRVNFTSLKRIVDALDGIEVKSKYSFSQNGYYFSKGTNYLDGEEALAFCRNRKSFADGEQQRGKNQLEVIKGIFNKAISPKILQAYTDVFDEIIDSVQTNLTADDIKGLVKMQLKDGASWNIETAAIRVDYKNDYCYALQAKACVGIMQEESRLEVLEQIKDILK